MASKTSKTSKGKKVINQDELRRLMKEKQRQTTDTKKRIESPYAKYNSLGHLSCVLCSVQVKSEILWQTHVLGKQHKEKVSEIKGTKPSSSHSIPDQAPQTSLLKRKALDSEDNNWKKPSIIPQSSSNTPSGLPADFFAKPEKPTGHTQKNSGLSLLSGTYDEDSDDDDDEEEMEAASGVRDGSPIKKELPVSGLPADFFDSSIPSVPAASHSGSIQKPDEPEKIVEKKDNTAEALPEGFFDDPVRDAKVRNVDAPQDLMDKEWEEFQKEMRQVNTKSEAIVAEDDEEGRLERQIDEIDEQIECYRRVELLRDKQDVVKEKTQLVKMNQGPQTYGESEDEEAEDEEELLHLLSRDWRAKGALA